MTCSPPIGGVARDHARTPCVVCRIAPSDWRCAQPTVAVTMCRLAMTLVEVGVGDGATVGVDVGATVGVCVTTGGGVGELTGLCDS